MTYAFKKRQNLQGDPIFTATIYGEMVIQNGEKNVQKSYEHTYSVPKSVVDQHGVLSPFKNTIAKTQFPILYPGFQSLMTHHIRKVTCESNPELVVANPNICNYEQLLEIVEDTDGDIELELYDDEYKLRQAVLDYIDDPEVFAAQQEHIRALRGNKAALTSKVLALNPLPQAPLATPVAVPEVPPVVVPATPVGAAGVNASGSSVVVATNEIVSPFGSNVEGSTVDEVVDSPKEAEAKAKSKKSKDVTEEV